MCHFAREADGKGILEDLLKNSKRNLTKSQAEMVYKPACNL